jgi:hypothetical protein
MIPAGVRNTHTRNVIATFHANETMTNQEGDGPETFKEYIKTLPEHIQQLLMHIEFMPGREKTLQQCLEKNMILKVGTNGSLNLSKGMASFGWLRIGNQNVLVQGAGPVDGVPSVLSLTRAELFGIAALNEFLFHFMKFHEIKSMSKVLKAVDNKALIA